MIIEPIRTTRFNLNHLLAGVVLLRLCHRMWGEPLYEYGGKIKGLLENQQVQNGENKILLFFCSDTYPKLCMFNQVLNSLSKSDFD